MPKETTGWFKHQLTLSGVDFDTLCKKLNEICSDQGFKIRKETPTEISKSFEAIYGSRFIAFLVGLIPYAGKHFPAGKRLFLEATISKQENSVLVNLGVTPYMELLNCEEFFPISQSIDEKATDEYFASLKLLRIIQNLFQSIEREVPSEFIKLDIKPFAKDAFWRFLLYPLESFKSPKPVFIPSARGPMWCWGAFIIPEVWFLWHEIWGASIMAFIVENIAVRVIEPKGFGLYVAIAGFLSVRIFTGLWGHRIYYYRYGKWLKPSFNQKDTPDQEPVR